MSVTRRQFLSASALAALSPAMLKLPFAAGARQGTPLKFEDLRGGAGIFTGEGGTIGWFVNADGAVAVDSQYMYTAPACVDGLKQRSGHGIQLLINTHHHADHVSGNPAFRKDVAHIVQQANCAKLHKDTTTANAAQQAYADTTFASSWSTTLGNDQISAKYYGPGHTGGDIIVVFERPNVVHMGDLMFNKTHPFIDRANGASILNWPKALTRIADEHKDALFIFGHARQGLPVTGTQANLISMRDYFLAVIDEAQSGIRAGKSLAEITKISVIPAFEDYAGVPPRRSLAAVLTIAYQELTAK